MDDGFVTFELEPEAAFAPNISLGLNVLVAVLVIPPFNPLKLILGTVDG